MPTSPIKYFAYMRKSSEGKERQALSLPAQRRKIIEAYGSLDIEFVDEERSAFVPYNRPKFTEMLSRMRAGERGGLLVWHPDRLSRNEVDAAAITYMLRTGEIADLKFPTYHFENSPEGIWMLQMALAQSQYDSAKKGRDVKRGLEQKAALGIFPSVAPLGYRNGREGDRGNADVVHDGPRFDLLRRAVVILLGGGYSVPDLWRRATDEWGLRSRKGYKVSLSNFYNVFTRPFYYGEFEYPAKSGKWYRGTHKPLMTRAEFERIQAILGRSDRPRPKTHREFAYRGDIHCGGCSALVTAEAKFKRLAEGGVRAYRYYHCTKRKDPSCRERSVEEKDLERQIAAALRRLPAIPSFTSWAKATLRSQALHDVDNQARADDEQRAQHDACSRRIDRLIDMRANGELDEDEFRTRKEALSRERARLSSRLQRDDAECSHWLEAADRLFDFVGSAATTFERAVKKDDVATKREVFTALGSNHTLASQTLCISLDSALLPLARLTDLVTSVSEGFEPAKDGQGQRDLWAAYASIPGVLGSLDEVRTALMQGGFAFREVCSPSDMHS